MNTEQIIEEVRHIDASINAGLREGRQARPAGWTPTPVEPSAEAAGYIWEPTGWMSLNQLVEATGTNYETLRVAGISSREVDGLVVERRQAEPTDLARLSLDRRTKHLYRLAVAPEPVAEIPDDSPAERRAESRGAVLVVGQLEQMVIEHALQTLQEVDGRLAEMLGLVLSTMTRGAQ